MFVLILEKMMAVSGQKWLWLESGREWAAARLAAEQAKRAAEVLALVSSKDQYAGLPHVFTAEDFLRFIRNQDHSRTTLGIGSM